MSRGAQPETAQQTKQSIHHAFLALYDAMPFEQINVKIICTTANISRNTFYRYYANIDNLFEEIIKENSPARECEYIKENGNEITLEYATDLIADGDADE
jgi:AcrR family transcriptional regulator